MTIREVLDRLVFRASDLIAAGMSERTIRRRVADGVFIRVAPGLLCQRGLERLPEVRDLAAHLSSGAALTGPSAARFFPAGPVSELVPYTRPWVLTTSRMRLAVTRVPHPSPQTVLRKGIQVASPRQSALDCLRTLAWPNAQDLAFRSVQQGLLTQADLTGEALLLRHHRGTPQLRRLAALVDTNAHARSEALFHRKLRRAGLEDWTANLWKSTPVGRVCIDIAFEARMIAIEYDSPLTHATPERFRRDRRKWNSLKRLGWEVLNYTWSSITEEWPETLAEIRFFYDRVR